MQRQGWAVLIAGVLFGSTTALAEPDHERGHDRGRDRDPVVMDRAHTSAVLDDVLEELARIEGKTEGSGKGKGRGHDGCRDLAPELASVRHKLKQLREEIQHARELAPPPVAPPPMAPPPPAMVVIAGPDFRDLLRALKAESFGEGKLRVLDAAAHRAWFATDQVIELLGQFDFGADKLKALEILAPRLIDPANAFRIYQAFEFDADKQKAKHILSTRPR